jgi:hypothetical protein
MPGYFDGRIQVQIGPVTITGGGTTSGVFTTQGLGLVGLQMPATFTGTTMSFLGSNDGGATYLALYNTSGSALSVTVAASRLILFTPGDLVGVQFIKLVSGSTESSDRIIQVITRTFV